MHKAQAPLFISVIGLNNRELTTDNPLVLKIEGLSVGGGGVTLGSKQYGYILFMRGDKGIDKQRYRYYRDNVLIPFIQESRLVFGECDKKVISESMKALS